MSSGAESQAGPEIIHFTGTWSSIPAMHRHFQAVDATMAFPSCEIENGTRQERNVLWHHGLERPDGYIFMAKQTANPTGGYNIYDLVIDEESSLARIYAIRALGEVVQVYSDEFKGIHDGWYADQRGLGIVLPNEDDKRNFERIFADFCTAAVTKQRAH